MPDDLYDRLVAAAAADRRTVSAWAVIAISDALDALAAKKRK